MNPTSLVFASLLPEQLVRISEQGGRIEVTPRRIEEGTQPYLCAFIHLDIPAAVNAFLDAAINKGAVLDPAQRLPRLGVARKLFICGFLNTHDGSYWVSNISAKA